MLLCTGLLALLLGFPQIGENEEQPAPESPKILAVRMLVPADVARKAGWLYQNNKWNWCQATVSNPSTADLDAVLLFKAVIPNDVGQFNISKPIHIPAQCDMKIGFPVGTSAPSIPGVRFEIELVNNGIILDRKRLMAEPKPRNTHVFAVLDNSPGPWRSLQNRILYPKRGPQLQSRQEVRNLYLTPNLIPDDSRGLDLIDTLVLTGTPDLNALQWRGIEQWVAMGGNLIYVPSSDTELPRIIKRILPVSITGLRKVNTLPFSDQWAGAPIRLKNSISFIEAELLDGEVLVGSPELTVVARRRHSMGSCYFVAFESNSILTDIEPYRELWMKVLEHSMLPPTFDMDRVAQNIDPILEEFSGKEVVSFWFPAIALSTYLALVVALLKLTQSPTTIPWRWPAVTLLSTGGTICIVAMSRLFSPLPETTSDQFEILEGSSGASRYKHTVFVNLIPSAREQATLSLPEHLAVMPIHDETSTVTIASLQPSPVGVELSAEKQSPRRLRMQGVTQFEGLTAIGHLEEAGVRFEVTNATTDKIESTILKLGRDYAEVGDLEVGQTKLVEFPIGGSSAIHHAGRQIGGMGIGAGLRQRVFDTLYVAPLSIAPDRVLNLLERGYEQGTSSQCSLIGWSNKSYVTVPEVEATRSLTLLAVAPEFSQPPVTFSLPRGSMRMELPIPSTWRRYLGHSSFRGQEPVPTNSVLIRFSIPEWARDPVRASSIRSAWLVERFESSAFEVHWLVNGVPLDNSNGSDGRWKIPDSVLGEHATHVNVEVQVTPRISFSSPDRWQGNQWLIREVEIECVCVGDGDD